MCIKQKGIIYMGLLSGLESFGIQLKDGLENNLFEKKADTSTNREPDKVESPKIKESDLLFQKEFACPVCETKFKHPSLRGGKVRFLGTDMDLKPNYEMVEPLKYDIISCPYCGYTAVLKYFPSAMSYEKKEIKEKISPTYTAPPFIHNEVYSYDDALLLYKLGLACSIVKKAHDSEKAYTAMKTGWLIRCMKQEEKDSDKQAELNRLETEYLKAAKEGFVLARQKESFPIAGMDESSLDYLICILAYEVEDYQTSLKLMSDLLTSQKTPKKIKDKLYDLKEQLKSKCTN